MFGQSLCLTIDGAELALEWAGDEPSPSELLAAHAVIREAHRAVPLRERIRDVERDPAGNLVALPPKRGEEERE
jgi:hypothetical protein